MLSVPFLCVLKSFSHLRGHSSHQESHYKQQAGTEAKAKKMKNVKIGFATGWMCFFLNFSDGPKKRGQKKEPRGICTCFAHQVFTELTTPSLAFSSS